ncbi:hypothetical protein LUZ60_015281 [Juncus effusus]|nr:hypothetical protein LUZ60_015281 [Juncus effusus]
MAPKRKAKEATAAPAKAVSLSPRRTRSGTAGKRAAPAAVVEPPAKKAVRKKIRFSDEVKEELSKVEENGATGEEKNGEGEGKTVVIEACKQCNQFKIRAHKVKEGLEATIPNITVTINPEKPRRGCFEVREEDGEIFISLLDMKRPFAPMKKLDMDEVINDIIKKIA